MTLMKTTLVLLVSGSLSCVTWLQAQQTPPSPTADVRNILRCVTSPPQVQDVSCDAKVVVRHVLNGLSDDDVLRPTAVVGLGLHYDVKFPSEAKIAFTAYESGKFLLPNHIAGFPGTTLTLHQDILTISSPGLKQPVVVDVSKVRNSSQDTNNVMAVYGASSVPRVDMFIHDFLRKRQSAWDQATVVGHQQIDGVACPVLELRYSQLLKPTEPNFISATRRTIDTVKGVIVKEQDIDEDGDPVNTTDFQNFQKTKDGSWVSLNSKTVSIAGWTKLTTGMNNNADAVPQSNQEVDTGSVRIPGRIIEKTYRLIQDKYPLVVKITVKQDNGSLISETSFSNYKVNQGLPDSLF